MTDDSDYNLIVRFEDQTSSFTNGYEAGMIWQQMQDAKDVDMTVHSDNMIVLTDMAMATGYEIEFEATEYDEWLYCKATKTEKRKFTVIDGGIK